MAGGEGYPKRESYFAVRFCRMLDKSCARQSLGKDAVNLLSTIALQEDAKRYRGPVTYFNSPLCNILGLTKWDQLDKARTVAVAAGYLHYTNQGKRSPGIYWVLIPAGCEAIDDSPTDEGEPTYLDGRKIGFVEGWNACAKKHGHDTITEDEATFYTPNRDINRGINVGINTDINRTQKTVQSVLQNGDKQGEPSCPSPSPVPNPDPNTNPPLSPQGDRTGFVTVDQVELPDGMDTPEVMAALEEWLAYKRSRKQGYRNSSYVQRLLNRFAIKFGSTAADEFVQAVDVSISSNWAGCFPGDKTATTTPKKQACPEL